MDELPVGFPASHGVFVLAGKVKCPAGDTDWPSSITFYLLFSAYAACLCRQSRDGRINNWNLDWGHRGEAKGGHTLARRTTLLASALMIHNVPVRVLESGAPQSNSLTISIDFIQMES